MAMRDATLFPGLEGSMHINLALATQFMQRYFQRHGHPLILPPSLLAGRVASRENPYLMTARNGGAHGIEFAWFLSAYRGFSYIPNVALFARQAIAFRRLAQLETRRPDKSDLQISTAMGRCLAEIAYGGLIAENAMRLNVAPEMVSVIFSLLVSDLNASAMQLALVPSFDAQRRALIQRMMSLPRSDAAEWDQMAAGVQAF
jgi:hypothetical protein